MIPSISKKTIKLKTKPAVKPKTNSFEIEETQKRFYKLFFGKVDVKVT
jgi:hypothetical protein